MSDVVKGLLERVFARDAAAVRALVAEISPIIQLRVARSLVRQKATRALGRAPEQEVFDFVQDVLLSLFADDARVLRAWNPARGLSLPNFVGLLAEHHVATVFRSGRRRPWSEDLVLEEDADAMPPSAVREEETLSSRDLYARVLEGLRARLTPRGLDLFHRLIVEEQPIEAVAAATGLSADAIYTWRSRLLKAARTLLAELDPERASLEPAPRHRVTSP